MPTVINGQIYYRTSEACQKIGISRATFYRWLGTGVIPDILNRDRNGWRLFTQEDIARIKFKANRINQK